MLSSRLCKARYVGPMNQLRGKTCLADTLTQKAPEGMAMVQFDDLTLTVAGRYMARGWHPVKLEYLVYQPVLS